MCGRILCALEKYLLAFPVGRWGEPEDVAGVAVFLASKDLDLLHAVVLSVDGGFLVR
ncbi:MAG: SDR family oxidoreductase [Gemmatimonadetes bacterium]|nr:SDR family oxidoreductase [Gemmatimonadota bacterium]